MKEINYKEAFDIGNEAKRIALKQSRIDPPFIETYYRALLFMAQEFKQFDSYLMYIERNRDPEKQFYLPRRDLLMATGVIQALQRMLDDELDILSVSMPPRVGKALAMGAKVLTPGGFVRNDSLKVGDKVISGTGKVSTVLGVYPQGKKPMYDVIFDDGSKVRCSIDHLWTVQTRDDRNKKRHPLPKYRTIPLSEMLPNLSVEGNKRSNYSIDYVPRIDFEPKEYELHPYVVGALIGDGSLSGGNLGISTPDDEVKTNVVTFLPEGYELVYRGDYDYYINEPVRSNDPKGIGPLIWAALEYEQI